MRRPTQAQAKPGRAMTNLNHPQRTKQHAEASSETVEKRKPSHARSPCAPAPGPSGSSAQPAAARTPSASGTGARTPWVAPTRGGRGRGRYSRAQRPAGLCARVVRFSSVREYVVEGMSRWVPDNGGRGREELPQRASALGMRDPILTYDSSNRGTCAEGQSQEGSSGPDDPPQEGSARFPPCAGGGGALHGGWARTTMRCGQTSSCMRSWMSFETARSSLWWRERWGEGSDAGGYGGLLRRRDAVTLGECEKL